jgi:phage regulator Rha-like protein
VNRRIESLIYIIREERVMLDKDLAALYQVETKALVQAVQRNRKRFPPDFMFQLSFQEFTALRSQIVTSKGRGGRRTPPYAFTEHGVAMLSSVLRSERAMEINIEIIRAFVKLRQLVASNTDLANRLNHLEQKYDSQFKVVFDAIRRLMSETTQVPPKRRIGF